MGSVANTTHATPTAIDVATISTMTAVIRFLDSHFSIRSA